MHLIHFACGIINHNFPQSPLRRYYTETYYIEPVSPNSLTEASGVNLALNDIVDMLDSCDIVVDSEMRTLIRETLRHSDGCFERCTFDQTGKVGVYIFIHNQETVTSVFRHIAVKTF